MALTGLTNTQNNEEVQGTQCRSKKENYRVTQGLLEPFISNYRFQDYQFKQLYACASYSDESLVCWGLLEGPNCHRQMKGNCLGTTREPQRLKPATNCPQSEFFFTVDRVKKRRRTKLLQTQLNTAAAHMDEREPWWWWHHQLQCSSRTTKPWLWIKQANTNLLEWASQSPTSALLTGCGLGLNGLCRVICQSGPNLNYTRIQNELQLLPLEVIKDVNCAITPRWKIKSSKNSLKAPNDQRVSVITSMGRKRNIITQLNTQWENPSAEDGDCASRTICVFDLWWEPTLSFPLFLPRSSSVCPAETFLSVLPLLNVNAKTHKTSAQTHTHTRTHWLQPANLSIRLLGFVGSRFSVSLQEIQVKFTVFRRSAVSAAVEGSPAVSVCYSKKEFQTEPGTGTVFLLQYKNVCNCDLWPSAVWRFALNE